MQYQPGVYRRGLHNLSPVKNVSSEVIVIASAWSCSTLEIAPVLLPPGKMAIPLIDCPTADFATWMIGEEEEFKQMLIHLLTYEEIR